MKKLLFLVPLIIISCKKDVPIKETEAKNDSAIVVNNVEKEKSDSIAKRDSIINNSPTVKKVLRQGIMRHENGNEISREADASQLPFSLGESFTNDKQTFILKIKNFENKEISANLTSDKDMNIRINQVKLPDGTFDGPFGKDLKNYKIPKKGEVWLLIGKSNMASGNQVGSFTISVE